MLKLSIIGTSPIVEEHIKVAKKIGLKLFSISTTRKNSKNLKYFYKKYKFKFIFNNWKTAVNFASKSNNIVFLIAPRIKDTFKILNYILEKKIKYVFVEKPLSTNVRIFDILSKYKKNIFIGYNRIFYKNIIFLKKNLKQLNNVIVKCPEINKKGILNNSVHVLSILIYLFGDLKIFNINKSKRYIFVHLKNKKNISIYLFFNFKASDNFSMEFYTSKEKFLLKPLENLIAFNGIKKEINSANKKLTDYVPIKKYQYHEMYNNSFKPGFLEQMKMFKKFAKYKIKIENDLTFAKKIMVLANSIVN